MVFKMPTLFPGVSERATLYWLCNGNSWRHSLLGETHCFPTQGYRVILYCPDHEVGPTPGVCGLPLKMRQVPPPPPAGPVELVCQTHQTCPTGLICIHELLVWKQTRRILIERRNASARACKIPTCTQSCRSLECEQGLFQCGR